MKMRFKWFNKFMLLTLLGGALLPAAPVLAQGQVLNVQVEVEPSSLDSCVATDGTSFEVMGAISEGLMIQDEKGNAVPALAEKVETSQDGKTITYKLREAQWSNGDPVKAQDFVFAWRRLADPKTASEYSDLLDIASIENGKDVISGKKKVEELGVKALDDKTLEVKLEQPTAFFNDLMAFPPFYPINQKFFESTKGKYATSADTILANGPFKVANYQPAGSSFELVKNDHYYNKNAIKLDGIKYQVIKDFQQAVLAYQTGSVDLISLSGEQVDLFKADPEFKSVEGSYLWYIAPNEKNKDLANQNLRLALGTAFNRKTIVENVLKDGSLPATYLVPTKIVNGPDGKDYREMAGKDLMVSDQAKAKKFYEQAKKELGKDKFKFKLLCEDTEASINVSQSLEAQIESTLPGVDIQIEQVPKKNRLQRMDKGDYELGLTRWGPDYKDPSTYLQLLLTGGNYNYESYSNKEYDQLYADAMTGSLVQKPKERFEAFAKAEKIALSQGAVLPVYQKSAAIMTKANVKGIQFNTVGVPRQYNKVTKQ
ncbi:peptide ABC transporter substrate-binding protein [Vaginisenegalia massiliensis]|uniref:peptide ABC transporter substrate-binding protein n=1 Tax=Vaginisenegalia massiliensis TaxID=2058294 RepID=UPI000F53EAEE|nr:peptide ABC transporter substrate-binding protein [Vaginisenegalia massiliensis]